MSRTQVVCLCYTMVYKLTKMCTNDNETLVCLRISSSYILKCKHATLAINKLNNIFPLHTKTISSQVSQCATPNLIMSPKEVTYVDK
jgi:hypothetical protein